MLNKRYLDDEILRLSVEMSLLISRDGFTISMIAEGLKIDKNIVRNDIISLFLCEDYRDMLYIDDDSLDSNDYSLEDYRELTYELTDIHKYIADSISAQGYGSDVVKTKEYKAFLKKVTELINYLFEKLPENRDVEIEWQQKVKEILKELGRKNLVFIKKDSKDKTIKGSDKREELNKQLDNAKKRYRNYIIGTTQEGMKKCHAVDGYSKGIMSGCYDDTVFRLDPSFLGVDESKDESLLVLSSDEYTHLGEYLKKQKKSLRKMDGIFKVKNSLEMKVEEAAAKYKILEIIKSGKCVRFSYKSPKENKESVVSIKPKYINYNADTGFMYIVDWAGYKYRFDRIWGLSFEKCFETFDDESKLDVKPILSQETIDVKVIIRKREDPVMGRYEGLINKIKEDVRRRNMDPDYHVDEHFSETDEAYIYEDQILANERGEFKSWVYSYGSSMVVVEPRDLRDEIVASYKARLDYY